MNTQSFPFEEPTEPDVHDLHLDDPKPPTGLESFVQQIKDTADKLILDGASRGDVKMLSTALRELRYSFKVFSEFRNVRKVTVFGSARTKPEHPSYQAAVEFGRKMAQAGYMVITGAAAGIMEAGHVGAGREMSIGINILLPFEQSANPIINNDPKLMHLKYFFTRKLLFVKETDAVVLLPGGFGTLDEGFEVLTLIQTGKSHMFPIVFLDEPGGDYWKPIIEFFHDRLLSRGLISPADLHLFKHTDSVDEAVAEVQKFYRVYHSMRYIRDRLVFRLQKSLSEAKLQQINDEFRDILVDGTFEMTEAHPHEVNDTHIADLPRLRFQFDRHKLGRLRLLIDTINSD